MQVTYLKLFVPEALRHGDSLLYEWILRQASSIGIHGGTASRAIAGFGRHGHLHEQHFFELAGDVPIILDFFATEDVINRLLALLKTQKESLTYIKLPAEAGATN
jgi:PII-like signaling protein